MSGCSALVKGRKNVRSPLGALLMLGAVLAAAADPAAAVSDSASVDRKKTTSGSPPEFGLPVDCQLGRDCFVQSLVDVDPGPGARDHTCGAATYDGHKGTDIRVLSLAQARSLDVAVIAAADGVVSRGRDGMRDVLLRDLKSRGLAEKELSGRECGNGLVIRHGRRWKTQYCHLRKGSVRPRAGDHVRRGDVIGYVGSSGKADFAHVHFEVRRAGRVIDPFLGEGVEPACGRLQAANSNGALWSAQARSSLEYAGVARLISTGFAGAPVASAELERDHVPDPPMPDSRALVWFARAINLKAGDRVRLVVDGPGGFSVRADGKPVKRSKAVWIAYAGKRLRQPRWPAGRYRGVAEIIRDGAVVDKLDGEVELD